MNIGQCALVIQQQPELQRVFKNVGKSFRSYSNPHGLLNQTINLIAYKPQV